MYTTIPTPNPIHSISKNKQSYDDISRNNTVTYTHTASSPSFLSSYKETTYIHTHHTYVYFQSIIGGIGTDQTGRFFVPSLRGKNYLLAIFDIYSNYIFSKPMPNRTKQYIKNPYANILEILQNRGVKTQLQRLDNETSDIIK